MTSPPTTPPGLVDLLVRAGFQRVDPPILQPADILLDVSGEELRRRLYLTTDPEGRELCLRPDLTIPTARLHLETGDPARPGRYSYLGPVFRYRPNGTSEFVQAGAESFGGADRPREDADIVALAVAACATLGLDDPVIRIGDVGLLAALVDALALSPAWRRRLIRGLAKGREAALAALAGPQAQIAAEHPGLLAAIAGVERRAARAIVEDLLSIAGIAAVGARTPGEIAERFLEQASLAESTLSPEIRGIVAAFLSVTGSPGSVAAQLRTLASDAGLALDAVLDLFEQRSEWLAGNGIEVDRIEAATAFGRNLDYYTGLVFEFTDPARPGAGVLAGGGRYDRLLTALGAAGETPAVGFSLWPERFAETSR